MSLKSFASPIALATAAALAFGGAAFAQTMVGDQTVSDEDLASVQTHCDDLLAAEPSTDAATVEPEPDTEGADNDASATMEGGVDLNLITLEDCRAAGLVQ